MKQHPEKHELLAYAESLVSGAPISAAIAGHVAGCPSCSAEAKAMRGTLEVVAQVPELEPTAEFTATLLMEARRVRKTVDGTRRREVAARFVNGLGIAATFLLIAAVLFQQDFFRSSTRTSGTAVLTRPSDTLATESARKAEAEAQTLAAAVGTLSQTPKSLREWEQQRTVLALDSDIAEAMSALERNPGCARASHMVSSHIQRKAETLRTLYIEKSP